MTELNEDPIPDNLPSFRIENGNLIMDDKDGKVPHTYRIEDKNLILTYPDGTAPPAQRIENKHLIATI